MKNPRHFNAPTVELLVCYRGPSWFGRRPLGGAPFFLLPSEGGQLAGLSIGDQRSITLLLRDMTISRRRDLGLPEGLSAELSVIATRVCKDEFGPFP